MGLIKNYKKVTIAVTLGVILLAGYVFYINIDKLGTVIMPFVIGGLIAYILNPLVNNLQKRKFPRWLAIALIYLLFLLVIVLCLNYFIPKLYSNISDLISNIPMYTEEYNQRFNNFQSAVNYSSLPIQIKNIVISQIHANVSAMQSVFLVFLNNSIGTINSIFSLVVNFVLGLIIGFYVLKDIDYFKKQAASLVPRRWRGTTGSTVREINVLVTGFIQGQLLIAAIIGTLEIIGLSIAGVKYAFILGLIGGIANIIPYFGPFIGAVPAISIALLDSPMKALFAALVFIIVQQIDNAFITPRVMSEKCGMHPLLIIFVVLLGGSLFGILGLVLAVPITAIIKVISGKIIERIV